MKFLVLKFYFLTWYYSQAFRDLYRIWGNFLWFIYNFFSLSLLTRTLFSPWRRISEERKKHFDIYEMFSTVVVNVLMRSVGVCIRLVFIAVGILSVSTLFVAGILAFFVWALFPFFLTAMLLFGIGFIFFL